MRVGYLWLGVELVAGLIYISLFGFASLVLECIITAIIGFSLAFRAGFISAFNQLSFYGVRDIFSNIGYSLGGVLLFIPGLVSDFVGVLIVIAAFLIGQNLAPKNDKFKYGDFKENRAKDDGEIIDVEIVEEKREIR